MQVNDMSTLLDFLLNKKAEKEQWSREVHSRSTSQPWDRTQRTLRFSLRLVLGKWGGGHCAPDIVTSATTTV